MTHNTRIVLIPTYKDPERYYHAEFRIKPDTGGNLYSPCSQHPQGHWALVQIEYSNAWCYICPICKTLSNQTSLLGHLSPCEIKSINNETSYKMQHHKTEPKVTSERLCYLTGQQHKLLIDYIYKYHTLLYRETSAKHVIDVVKHMDTFVVETKHLMNDMLDVLCVDVHGRIYEYALPDIENYKETRLKEPIKNDDSVETICNNLTTLFGNNA